MYYTGTCGDGISNANGGCWIADAASSADWNYLSSGFLAPVTGTITIAQDIAGPGTLVTDDYSLVEAVTPPVFPAGIVTLTFDDGWQSFADNATSSLLAKGLKATNYIITSVLTPDTNCTTLAGTDYYLGCYMSTSTVQALQTEGFDIGAHTRNHLDLVKDAANPTMLSLYGYANASELWASEINGSKSDLIGAGFTPVDSFAYPYGSYDRQVEQLVHDAGFLGARSVDQGFNLEDTDRYALKMQHVTNTTTAANIETWIQQALANKTWLILMFHDVRAGTETQGSLNPKCVELADNNGNSYLDASGNPLPSAPNPLPADLDCTTLQVLSDVATYLAAQPTGTVKTMHDVLSAWPDTIAPVIVLNGALTMTVPAGGVFTDPGVFSVTDNKDVVPSAPVVTTVDSFNGTATTTPSINTKISGIYVLKYSVQDAALNVGSTTRTVIVAADTPPVVTDIATSTIVNIPAFITLKGTDVDGNTLTFATTSNPTDGILTGSGANLVYTATTTGFIGTDFFTFKANDGIVDSNIATVTINVLAAPDVTPPTISVISAGTPGQTAATITWTTNEVSNSRVIYGTDSTYGATTTLDTTMTTTHSVALSGLVANSGYHFAVISGDISGNYATSSDQNFSTAGVSNSGGSGSTSTGSSGGGGGGGGGVTYSYGVSINNAATQTNNPQVTLTITPAGTANQMWVSNDPSFSTGSWITFQNLYPWTLSSGDGVKTAYVRYGASGNIVASAQASITLSGSGTTASTGGLVLGASTQTLTDAQIAAIINLLKSFNADQSVIDAVNASLHGQASASTGGTVASSSDGFVFTQRLQMGSTGNEVTELQKRLGAEGVYSGPVTGYFGALTKAAVIAYQKAHSLPQVGIVGPQTRAVLNGKI